MKKMIFAGCLMAGASVFAQAGETDSLKVVNLQEVQGADSIHTCHFKNPGGIHQRFERRTQKAELRARHPFSAQYDSFGTDHQ